MAEAAAQVALGERELIEVGDPDLTRDWGNAVDGVECMWLCLQQNEPRDYIFATGKGHTVRDFMDTAFRSFGIRLRCVAFLTVFSSTLHGQLIGKNVGGKDMVVPRLPKWAMLMGKWSCVLIQKHTKQINSGLIVKWVTAQRH
jgi:hypothetical protein